MVSTLLLVAVLVGLTLVLLTVLEQLRRLAQAAPGDGGTQPPVSVLKPLKGVDCDLESNLETFFHLEYPTYELVFGVQDPADPALQVARRVADRHPGIVCRFASTAPEVGVNPKVNNLAGMLPLCRHEVLMISDSNVAVTPDILRSMMTRLEGDNVGLVTSLIRGCRGRGLGGALEELHLNTFVMGSVAAVDGVFGRVCAVGKSMLFRRSDLEAIGGLEELGRFLAEDQILGESIRALGKEVTVCPRPVDNVLGSMTVREFSGRFLRWARIRRRISLGGYLAEVLANPMVAAALLTATAPGVASGAVALATLSALVLAAIVVERRLGVRRPLAHYPPLVLLRSLLAAVLWLVPFASSSLVWRGRRLRIGYRTLLVPDADWSAPELADLEPEEAAA
jgi:ceramide glucosyltransferase